MKAFIKKEAIELAIPFTCLLVLVCALWIGVYRPQDVLWAPAPDPVIAVLCAGGIGGFLLALIQFYAERIRRTHGYLVHRGARAMDVFVSKAIIGLVATYALACVPPLVFAAWKAAFSPFAATIQWERVAEFAWIGTFGLCGYAAGAACAQLRRNAVNEICFGVAAGLTFAFFAHISAMGTVESSPAIRYVMVQLVVAAASLVVAYRLFARPVDRDLPLPRGIGAIVGVSGIVLFVAPALVGYALTQENMQRSLRDERPVVLRERATGRFLAVRDQGERRYAEIDAHGEVVLGASLLNWDAIWGRTESYERIPLPQFRAQELEARSGQRGVATSSFNGRWNGLHFRDAGATFFRADNGGFDLRGFFDPRAGVVHLFFEPRSWSREIAVPGFSLASDRPFAVTLRRPDARGRFSASTTSIEAPRADMQRRNVCLFDPADGSLWEIDPFDRAAPVRALSLPDGDRVVDAAMTRVQRADGGAFERDVVVGERGSYTWDGAELEPLDTAKLARADNERDYRVALTDPDPIAPQFEIRSATDDTLLFSLDARPRGISAWATTAGLHLVALTRSPLFNTVSFLSPADARMSTQLLGERLFFGQRRLATLLAGIAIAVIAARGTARRLRERGAGALAVRAWTIAILVLGPAAQWLFLILEPRKSITANGPTSSDVEPRTSLLIESRAPSVPSGAQGIA